jgi:hypothetical protein
MFFIRGVSIREALHWDLVFCFSRFLHERIVGSSREVGLKELLAVPLETRAGFQIGELVVR